MAWLNNDEVEIVLATNQTESHDFFKNDSTSAGNPSLAARRMTLDSLVWRISGFGLRIGFEGFRLLDMCGGWPQGGLFFRENHLVDDVDDAVAGDDVGLLFGGLNGGHDSSWS